MYDTEGLDLGFQKMQMERAGAVMGAGGKASDQLLEALQPVFGSKPTGWETLP